MSRLKRKETSESLEAVSLRKGSDFEWFGADARRGKKKTE